MARYKLTKLFKEMVNDDDSFLDSGENTDYEIFVDMDGTITDFNKRFIDLVGEEPHHYEKREGIEEFWNQIDNVHGVKFWAGMEWMPAGQRLWNYVQKAGAKLLSSPSWGNTSRLGKRIWVKHNIPGTKLILTNRARKQNYSGKDKILIDDRQDTIDEWNAKGGIGILFTDTQDTINKLKELGI